MTGKDLIKIGFKPGPGFGIALRLIPEAAKVLDNESLRRELKAILDNPAANLAHPQFAELAQALHDEQSPPAFLERADPAPFQIWGENLEPTSVDQMKAAVRLP